MPLSPLARASTLSSNIVLPVLRLMLPATAMLPRASRAAPAMIIAVFFIIPDIIIDLSCYLLWLPPLRELPPECPDELRLNEDELLLNEELLLLNEDELLLTDEEPLLNEAEEPRLNEDELPLP